MYPQALTIWLEPNPAVVTYHRPARHSGRPKWSPRRRIGALIDIVTTYSSAPLRFAAAAGLASAVLSFAYGLAVGVTAVLGYSRPSGVTSILIIVTFLLGMVLMAIGTLGEYLVRILREFDDRPIYRVKHRTVSGFLSHDNEA